VVDDGEVVRRSIDEPAAFEEVFHRHYDAVLRYARQRVGHDVGEEIAARTFVIAFSRRAVYDARRPSARPWLMGIATNLVRHHNRDERVHIAALTRLPIDPDVASVDDPDRLDAERLRPFLLEALMDLSPRDREPFILLAIGDLTYQQIAEALGIPLGTVRSRLHRARTLLRERLGALEETTGTEGGVRDRTNGDDDA
jgi:RNA polymerase sigma factor (sigma-70 family)